MPVKRGHSKTNKIISLNGQTHFCPVSIVEPVTPVTVDDKISDAAQP